VTPRSPGLRAVTEADTPLLFAIYASTRTDELAAVSWTEEQKATFLTQQYEAQWTSYTSAHRGGEFSVIELDGVDVGRFYCCRLGDGEIRILDISLLPVWRHRGIGTALLGDLLARADRDGVSVSLHVDSHNPARAWYYRLGFIDITDDPVYVLMRRPARTDPLS
jgi:ribosomal protein S18 acetylase RimI-like enzyme